MAILNPIVNAGVQALEWALEPERRLQELLRLWLGNYFTGVPFTTRAAGGATTTKTFPACAFLWQDDVMPVNPQQPVIHVLLTPTETQRLDLAGGVFGHGDRWQLDVMIRVPANLSGTPMSGTPEQVARRVADQVQWLCSSGEREALAVHGVNELKVERPPVPLMLGQMHARLMTASCLTRREQAR